MKKAICILLLLCMILCAANVSFAGGTAENKIEKAKPAADDLFALGLFSGTGTDSAGNPIYALERSATRAEAITMLVKLLGKTDEAIHGSWETPFTDVPAWAEPFVGYAYANGLSAGTGATTFGSASPVTATQYLTFVLKALGYEVGIDFQWDKAWELTDKLGITNGEYNAKNNKAFIRGDAVIVSHRAIYENVKGSDKTLLSCIFNANTKDVYFSRRQTDQQLAALKNSSLDTLRKEISTVADAVAYLDMFNEHFYSRISDCVELNAEFMLNLHRNEATASDAYTAITAWCLQDDYPDIRYIIGLVGTSSDDSFYPAAHTGIVLPVESGFTVITPAVLSKRNTAEDIRGFKDITVPTLSNLDDDLQLYCSPRNCSDLYIMNLYSSKVTENVVFTLGKNRLNPEFDSAVELYRISEAEIQEYQERTQRENSVKSWWGLTENWDSYGLSESMQPTLTKSQVEDLIGKDIDTVAKSLKTLGDCLYYYALSGYTGSGGDLQLRDNTVGQGNLFWHFNYAPQVVFDKNTGNCGGSSGLTSYLLKDDYKKVGMIGITFAEGTGGGHYINYLYDGNNYYAFDIVNLVSQFSQRGFCFSSGKTLAEAAEKWMKASNFPVRLMCAFQGFDGDMPLGWDWGNSHITYLSDKYRSTAEVLMETPSEGYVCKWVSINEKIAKDIASARNPMVTTEVVPVRSKDYMARVLTDEQIEMLKWADLDTLQSQISTVADAAAFLNQFTPEYFDAIDDMCELHTDIEKLLSLHRTEATAPSTYLAFTAWCLRDDQPGMKYIVSYGNAPEVHDLFYALAIPDGSGYKVVSPALYSDRWNGVYGYTETHINNFDNLNAELRLLHAGYNDPNALTHFSIMVADVEQEGPLYFQVRNDRVTIRGGNGTEVYSLSDAGKKELSQTVDDAWSNTARNLKVSNYGIPEIIGNTTLNYDSARELVGQNPELIAEKVKTVGDVLQYMIAAHYGYDAPPAYTPWYNGWGFDAPGNEQLVQNYGCCCGGVANTVSFLLRGDYEKVGTLRWIGGGNHTISWIYTGGKYYVFDFTQYCAGGRFDNYGSVVTILNRLEDFYRVMPETYSYFPKSEVELMIAFESGEAMYPSRWNDPPQFTGLTLPTEANGKITVIYQKDPNRGILYKEITSPIPGWND